MLEGYVFFPLKFRGTSVDGPFSQTTLRVSSISTDDGLSYQFPVSKLFRQPTAEELKKFESVVFNDYDELHLDKNDSFRENKVFCHTIQNFFIIIGI